VPGYFDFRSDATREKNFEAWLVRKGGMHKKSSRHALSIRQRRFKILTAVKIR